MNRSVRDAGDRVHVEVRAEGGLTGRARPPFIARSDVGEDIVDVHGAELNSIVFEDLAGFLADLWDLELNIRGGCVGRLRRRSVGALEAELGGNATSQRRASLRRKLLCLPIERQSGLPCSALAISMLVE